MYQITWESHTDTPNDRLLMTPPMGSPPPSPRPNADLSFRQIHFTVLLMTSPLNRRAYGMADRQTQTDRHDAAPVAPKINERSNTWISCYLSVLSGRI